MYNSYMEVNDPSNIKSILCLDIATRTGYCYDSASGLEFGHFNIPKNLKTHGEKFRAFAFWLFDLLNTGNFDLVAIEKPFIRGKSTFYLIGLCAIAEGVTAHYDIPFVRVPVTKIKKHFTNDGKASKIDMVTRATEMGYDVTVDDEADAIALHYYIRAQLLNELKKEKE